MKDAKQGRELIGLIPIKGQTPESLLTAITDALEISNEGKTCEEMLDDVNAALGPNWLPRPGAPKSIILDEKDKLPSSA